MSLLEDQEYATKLMRWWESQGSPKKDIHFRPEYIPDNPQATWWTQITPGTTYWRCEIPARKLPGQVLHLQWSDLTEDENGNPQLPRQIGPSIWQFVGNGARALLMAHLQSQNIPALVEVDDNYCVPIPHLPGKVSHWQTKLDKSPSDNYSIAAHRKIIKWADAIIVSTPFLGNYYETQTQSPIYVCPNSIDLDDWPNPHKKDDGIRRIGFAGSDSHRYDLHLIDRALDYAWRQPATEIWKIGSAIVEWRYPHKQIEWTDNLDQYRKSLSILNVGLCPLKRSNWHDAKSDIKAMEYLLAGAVPIVQGDSPAYSDWLDIVPSAVTEKDWRKVIKWACHAPWDELDTIIHKGQQYIFDNKLIEQHIHKWQEALLSQS